MLVFIGSSRGTKEYELTDYRKCGRELYYTVKAYADNDLVKKPMTMKQCMGIAKKVADTGVTVEISSLGYTLSRV